MPKGPVYPQLSVYLGWHIWKALDNIGYKYEMGASEMLQMLLNPVIDAYNEDRRKTELDFHYRLNLKTGGSA
jgi:hypothetical protein